MKKTPLEFYEIPQCFILDETPASILCGSDEATNEGFEEDTFTF